jgi:hypothetical protein
MVAALQQGRERERNRNRNTVRIAMARRSQFTARLLFSLLFVMCARGPLATTANTKPELEDRTILVQGSIRHYSVYRPASLRRFPPVVLMLHGRGMTREQAAEQFRWIELADQQQFIVAFPQALPIVPDLALGAPLPATLPAWFGSRNDALWWDSQYSRSFPFVYHPDFGAFQKLPTSVCQK